MSLPEQGTFVYADDVTLVASEASGDAAIEKLQSLLDITHAWSSKNRLCLNVTKCMSMLLAVHKHGKTTSPSAALRIKRARMRRISSVKILGVIFT